MTQNGKNTLTFEEAYAKLNEVIGQLQSGDGTLSELTDLFEEGVRLSRICNENLDSIEKKVEILTRSLNGDLQTQPFEAES